MNNAQMILRYWALQSGDDDFPVVVLSLLFPFPHSCILFVVVIQVVCFVDSNCSICYDVYFSITTPVMSQKFFFLNAHACASKSGFC